MAAYFVVLIALVAAAAAAAAAFVSVQADDDARRGAQRDARFAATTSAGKLGESLRVMRGTVDGVAQTLRGKPIPTTLSSSCALTFSGTDALPSGHVEIVRANGVVVCSSRPHAEGATLPGYPRATWLAEAVRRPLFLPSTRDRVTGGAAVVAAAPVDGHAVVAAFAGLAPIAHSLASLYGGGRPLEFVVTTADGRTVISRSIAPRRWAARSLAGRAFAARDGSTRDDLDGNRRIYESARIEPVGWRLYVGEDESAALAAGNSLRDRELWIIAAGVVAVVLTALVIYRRVAVPIRRLAAAVRASEPHVAATPVPVSGPAEVATLAGDVNGLIGSVGRELHERRQLEQQLRHAQKMDALGRVVAGVAHDFNNLVTVIAGFTSLILRSARREDVLRGHAEEVWRAAEGARMLIRQLLVFSRRETPQPAVLDANEVVGEMQSMLTRVLGPKVELAAELAEGPVVVEADRGQLEQVVMNLSVNARDAMSEGGRLTLATRTEALDADAAPSLGVPPGRYGVLAVADTGTGVPPEIRERLFEPFFTTKAPGEGTGLGLATCYGIVSQAGGVIDVESEPGRGSVFTVYLPLSDAPVARPGAQPAPQRRVGGSETILVVEDDEGLRALTKIVLQEAGYAVLDARVGEEALSVADGHEGRIDLLLTDGVLAAMTGRELAQHFTVRHPESRVVYMSGYDPESVPADDPIPLELFLAKPFTPEALLAKVREVLDD